MNRFPLTFSLLNVAAAAWLIAAAAVVGNLITSPVHAEDRTTKSSAIDPADRPVIGLQHDGPIRVVYQISKDDWKQDVGKGLLYLKKLRTYYAKRNIDPARLDIRAVFHGEASTHLLTDDAYNRVKQVTTGNPNTDLIAELVASGVHLELCDSRRREEGWSKADIHPDVLLVEAAYARLIDLQLQGYAYIRF